jgi:hypothetical protein
MKPIVEIGLGIIDKLIPDREARDKAKLELLRAEQDGQFREMELQLSAIIAEANSADPWTSRARPSFLYVVYTLLLFSLPMGVMTVYNPEAAALFTDGFRAWLGAIPEEILTLFGVVMTGYVAGRSWEKVKGVAK